MNTFDLASKKTNLKKVASTHGGEWAGPCPECGGTDRFRVWPNENSGKGGYWCRSCGKAGDNIQFLIDFEGMDFKEACAYMNIEKPDRDPDRPPQPRREFTPTEHQSPDQLWQEKAEKFVTWAQENLSKNQQHLDWLAARGIDRTAAEAARLGWNPGENGKDIFRARKAWGLPEQIKENGKPRMLWIPRGLVIPYVCHCEASLESRGNLIQRLRIRRPDEVLEQERLKNPDKEPARYVLIPGSSMATMIIGADRKAFVIVESELDGIACAAATELSGAVAMGMLEGKPDAAAFVVLSNSKQILNALDFGDQGGGKVAGKRAMQWWAEQFGDKCERWPVPQGKDPGEAFALGIDLESWIKAGLPPVVTIDRPAVAETKQCSQGIQARKQSAPTNPPEGTPPLLSELWKLLRANPAVKIINTPDRFTILKNGKYVSGRINYLVTREKEVTDYIFDHPSEEITWENLLPVVPAQSGIQET